MSTSENYKVCNENLRQKSILITKQVANIYSIYKQIHGSDILEALCHVSIDKQETNLNSY